MHGWHYWCACHITAGNLESPVALCSATGTLYCYEVFTYLTVDKKENGMKRSGSYHKPHQEDTNSGAVIMEDDGESLSDVNDNSEPVDLERQEQDYKPDAVSSDNDHSPSPAINAGE